MTVSVPPADAADVPALLLACLRHDEQGMASIVGASHPGDADHGAVRVGG